MENSFEMLGVPEHVLTEEEALKVLKEYLPRIRECMRRGYAVLDALRRSSPEMSVHWRLGTKASVICDAIRAAAREIFQGEKGVVISNKRGLFLLCIEGKINLRFKKLNKKGKTSGIRTNQQLNFAEQMQMVLPDIIVPPTNLTAAYRLDDFEMGVCEEVILCNFRDYVLYQIPVRPEINTAIVDINPDALPEEHRETPRVTIKKEFLPKDDQPIEE